MPLKTRPPESRRDIAVGMISLGCPKNLVDSEIMLGLLTERQFRIVPDVNGCDVAVVNTCAFIEDARKESIDCILGLADQKKKGKIRALVVCGCLPQKYYQALEDEIPEIDALVGTGSYDELPEIIENVLEGRRKTKIGDTRFLYDHGTPRYTLTPPHFKYIKIAEGCDHRCTFCIIPQLRGSYRSRPIRDIVTEVEAYAAQGTKEANLISQDTSYYGRDLDGRYLLPELLVALNDVQDLQWIRLLYNHPFHVTDEILNAMAACPKVCKYMDIPLQHVSDRMLKRMKRGMGKEHTVDLIRRIREKVPGIAIRTTFIVGFPGETEDDFRELSDFVRQTKFERLGVFAYSLGDDAAASLDEQVPEKIKRERRKALMTLQHEISLDHHRRRLGETVKVLVEKRDSTCGSYYGRTFMDAPEVDGRVRVDSGPRELDLGAFCNVRLTEALAYDLVGEVVA